MSSMFPGQTGPLPSSGPSSSGRMGVGSGAAINRGRAANDPAFAVIEQGDGQIIVPTPQFDALSDALEQFARRLVAQASAFMPQALGEISGFTPRTGTSARAMPARPSVSAAFGTTPAAASFTHHVGPSAPTREAARLQEAFERVGWRGTFHPTLATLVALRWIMAPGRTQYTRALLEEFVQVLAPFVPNGRLVVTLMNGDSAAYMFYGYSKEALACILGTREPLFGNVLQASESLLRLLNESGLTTADDDFDATLDRSQIVNVSLTANLVQQLREASRSLGTLLSANHPIPAGEYEGVVQAYEHASLVSAPPTTQRRRAP